MTRRRILFLDGQNNLYASPEFNGDKSELAHFLSRDFCDMNWLEVAQLFIEGDSLDEFIAASEKAQVQYHSCFGNQILPVVPIDSVEDFNADQVCLLKDHCLFPIHSDYQMLLDLAYEAYQTSWCNERGYNPSDWNENDGFNGESYVCKDEFEGAEFADRECMEAILPPIVYAMYCVQLVSEKKEY